MVDLCEECACLNHKFFELFNQLEKIKIQVTAHLTEFQEKLLQSGEVDRIAMGIRRWADSNRVDLNDKLEVKLEIAEVIRKDLTEKCSGKLKLLPPRVRLQKVTAEEIDRQRQRHPTRHHHPFQLNSHAFSSSEVAFSNIKMEAEHDHCNAISEEGGNDYFDEQGDKTNIPDSLKVDEIAVTSTATHNSNRSRYVRTKSGKFKCLVCCNVLASHKSAMFHYKTIHSNIRFKCSKCPKTFVQKGNLNAHYQGVHLLRRYPCQFCSQTFSHPSNRNHHLRKTSCSRRNSDKGPGSGRWKSRQSNGNHLQDPLEVIPDSLPANDFRVLPSHTFDVVNAALSSIKVALYDDRI